MEPATVGTLALLALADSTSFGTLLIPIWLLLASGRPRVSRFAAYLGTVAIFYLVVGLLLSAGARLFLDDLRDFFGSDRGAAALIGLGVVLIGVGYLLYRRSKRQGANSGRMVRWRERVMSAQDGSARPLMGLALVATLLEVATLLPYLIAIGIMTEADLPAGTHGALMAGYCVVMILPAVVLLVLRLVAARAVEPLLRRVNDWMSQQGAETTAIVVIIIGAVLVQRSAQTFGGIGEVIQHVRDWLPIG